MARIYNHDYETVTADCDYCGSPCTFNRIDDIGKPGPYCGLYVTCFVCGRQFWINGDLASPAFKFFISDADDRFRAKRYKECVASLAQAWEVFFSTFAYSNYLYRPFFALAPLDRDIEQLNQLGSKLHAAIANFTFAPLRNVLINTVFKRVHPQTLQESELAVPRIMTENFGQDLGKSALETFPELQVREILEELQRLQIGELRNKVIHQDAYRPRRAEVEKCRDEEIMFLYKVKRSLRIGTLDEWQAGII